MAPCTTPGSLGFAQAERRPAGHHLFILGATRYQPCWAARGTELGPSCAHYPGAPSPKPPKGYLLLQAPPWYPPRAWGPNPSGRRESPAGTPTQRLPFRAHAVAHPPTGLGSAHRGSTHRPDVGGPRPPPTPARVERPRPDTLGGGQRLWRMEARAWERPPRPSPCLSRPPSPTRKQ